MITDEMVEAAARIIWDAENGAGDYDRIHQKMPDVMKSPTLALNITARAALEAAERAAWRPISEAPKDGVFLVACEKMEGEVNGVSKCPGGTMKVEDLYGTLYAADTDAYYVAPVNPTHFRPLPTPPKDITE